MNRVAVIGIDGATWRLLDPWIEKGELKNFGRLKEEGAYGDLESVLPPITCPAWECMVTGKHPGALGLFSSLERKPGTYEIRISPFRWEKWNPIWEVLARHRRRSYVLNVPKIGVPRNASQFGGVFVTGPMLPETVLAYPPELDGRLKRIGYRLNLPDILEVGPEDFLRCANEATEMKFHVAAELYGDGRWDFFMFVFFNVDPIMHFFWRYMDPESPHFVPESPYAEAILDHYRRLDKYLGFFVDRLPEEAYLLVVSDHGHSATHKDINLNVWLREQGYLQLEKHEMSLSGGSNTDWKIDMDWRRMPDGTCYIDVYFRGKPRDLGCRLLELCRCDGVPVEEIRFRDDLCPSVPDLEIKTAPGFPKHGLQRLVQCLALAIRSVSARLKISQVDWEKTRAYAYTYASIFINLRGREPCGIVEPGTEYEKLVEEIRDRLYGWVDPDCGEPIVQEVLRPDEAYGGHPEGFPDLIVRFRDGGRYRSVTLIDMEYEEDGDFTWQGPFRDPLKFFSHHTDRGIVAAYGPDVSPGKKVIGASIPDVMPTVLHLMDVPIPDDVTGKPLLSLFSPDSNIVRRPVITQRGVDRSFSANSAWSEEEERAIKTHLKALGYID